MSNPAHSAAPSKLVYAAIHARAEHEAHPDSEEAVRHGSRRVSRELEPLSHYESRRRSLNDQDASHHTPSFASLRSRSAISQHSLAGSQEDLRRRDSHDSAVSTQRDAHSARLRDAPSVGSSLREVHWYTPVVKCWTENVCPTIEEGAFRDHLGMDLLFAILDR